MKFHDVIKNVLLPTPTEQPLSRIYGYDRDVNGKIQIVQIEARVISAVIQQLATQAYEPVMKILDDLVRQFADEGVRNRSGRRWTKQLLLGLVRPIYAGVAVSPRGVWRRSRLYPAIVSVERVRTALKRIKTEKVA
jgi:hypothetical protein